MRDQKHAKQVLELESERIKRLIDSQKDHLCFAQCPAFEEVVDTQMYGFSKQVAFAVSIDVISPEEGQEMLSELDSQLNQVYTDIFENKDHFRLSNGGQVYHGQDSQAD
ncbi:hypothetical protein AWM75_02890 [Aerococcus urinaehominis]|uniref:Uncharacterized protein n=1 Tax=Aerococcus urinaehominis TaxID=128944 RepID=A0A109RGV7_9LACT|nr:DUF1507 family protein [Aerococcus urinaehominis]AMB99006.1 hypothetical protein AWM75_02890 [Aerococcus urinaehominis]SDM57306.1 Uncharacterized protein YlaN, UPF0358 family [Aerococcus urinaehominis]